MSDRWDDRDDERDGRRDRRERSRDESRSDSRARPYPAFDRLGDERDNVRFGSHDYRLNEDDVKLLRTVGTFRAVYADHVRDEFRSLDYQVRQLREQGLVAVERIQTPNTHRQAEVLTLTREGHRLVTAGEDGDQRYHRGFVQPRELHHDAHLYCLVQREEEVAEARGARIERVRLDDELKREWWSRDLANLSDAERAECVGIGLDDRGRAVFPDVQIDIREADETLSRTNLELTTRHYDGRSLKEAAMSQFSLTRFGYTEREAAWLRHVLRHSGVFLRRQYLAWLGDRTRGAVDQRLLTHLLHRGHAVAWAYHRRERVYHLTNKALYEAIGEPDLRHRRPIPPHRLAQKLMLLDMTIHERQHRWLATEDEKVRFFSDAGQAPARLPHRVYPGTNGRPDTTRYYVDRFPILIEQDGRVGLVYPDFSGHVEAFRQFLADHLMMLLIHRDAGVVYVTARDGQGDRAEEAFHQILGRAADSSDVIAGAFLEYCELRRVAHGHGIGQRASQEDRFTQLHKEFGRGHYEELYQLYLASGPGPAVSAAKARLDVRRPVAFRHLALPHRYYTLGRPASSSVSGAGRRGSEGDLQRSKRAVTEPAPTERE